MPGWARRDPAIRYVCVPQFDLLPPTLAQLQQAVAAVDMLHEQGHTVVTCCALGYSRSALTVAAWLTLHLQIDDAQAVLALVREARPRVLIKEESAAAELSEGEALAALDRALLELGWIGDAKAGHALDARLRGIAPLVRIATGLAGAQVVTVVVAVLAGAF
ncbi:dual specificity protein phosphatase family protein [Paraburkholderia aromaticivorans]|uniref:dual specificity protein phosphatase family protein n=1 Tax=Paraburkholderia aromaticivorans TaxID=2026199 RepID=UPI001456123F|nr:dual specificity protein phosphatase family protein [Paraburkholderia aromaticivorans]